MCRAAEYSHDAFSSDGASRTGRGPSVHHRYRSSPGPGRATSAGGGASCLSLSLKGGARRRSSNSASELAVVASCDPFSDTHTSALATILQRHCTIPRSLFIHTAREAPAYSLNEGGIHTASASASRLSPLPAAVLSPPTLQLATASSAKCRTHAYIKHLFNKTARQRGAGVKVASAQELPAGSVRPPDLQLSHLGVFFTSFGFFNRVTPFKSFRFLPESFSSSLLPAIVLASKLVDTILSTPHSHLHVRALAPYYNHFSPPGVLLSFFSFKYNKAGWHLPSHKESRTVASTVMARLSRHSATGVEGLCDSLWVSKTPHGCNAPRRSNRSGRLDMSPHFTSRLRLQSNRF